MPDRVDQTVDLAELIRRPGPGSHRTVLDIDGQTTATLADLPPDRGGLLFVGLNPSPVSVEAGHYHQGRLGRMFWARLVKASILPPGSRMKMAISLPSSMCVLATLKALRSGHVNCT